ncbi:MAG TPA: hypothetical protein VFT98_05570 [Myxococcota bacterium]|nr:hypothetical protein [Myxococcota bacterium]
MSTARLALLAALAALASCSEAASPEEVALEFWTAAAAREYAIAAPFSTARHASDVAASLGSFAPEGSPAIGEALRSENRALVETTFHGEGADEHVAFETHLVQVDGAWRVDLAATADELGSAASGQTHAAP